MVEARSGGFEFCPQTKTSKLTILRNVQNKMKKGKRHIVQTNTSITSFRVMSRAQKDHIRERQHRQHSP